MPRLGELRVEALHGEELANHVIVLDAVLPHVEPGNPESLKTLDARRAAKAATRLLRDRGLNGEDVAEHVRLATQTAIGVKDWLEDVTPEDFNDEKAA